MQILLNINIILVHISKSTVYLITAGVFVVFCKLTSKL